MFKFDFSEVELEGDEPPSVPSPQLNITQTCDQPAKENVESLRVLSMEELAKALPPALSYSPISISTSRNDGNKSTVTLIRRDLFDARFQLIAQDEDAKLSTSEQIERSSAAENIGFQRDSGVDALAFIDNPSDLVPGIYEGGLKTWECSLDLVETLSTISPVLEWGKSVRGKRVLEVGCGTAIPSLYLLHELFCFLPETHGDEKDSSAFQIVLQDYNDLVLRLVTFPNVLLTWYASPLAANYREKQKTQDAEDETEFKSDEAGELSIAPELLSSFLSSLADNHVEIVFIAGSWEAMLNYFSDPLCSSLDLLSKPFDVILTSETIYRLPSLPTLITLLKTASLGRKTERSVEEMTNDLDLRSKGTLCLVAAKVLYFGVGGGVIDFERMIENYGGQLEIVLERRSGVSRRVMKVVWQ